MTMRGAEDDDYHKYLEWALAGSVGGAESSVADKKRPHCGDADMDTTTKHPRTTATSSTAVDSSPSSDQSDFIEQLMKCTQSGSDASNAIDADALPHQQMHTYLTPEMLQMLQSMQHTGVVEMDKEATQRTESTATHASNTSHTRKAMLTKDQKRANHIQCEQKRRIDQKLAYDSIAGLVKRENVDMGASSSSSQSKVKCRSSNTSKGVLLGKAVSLIRWLERTNECLEKEIDKWDSS